MAKAMLQIAEASPAPKRLLLGTGAYERVHAALIQRVAELEQYKAIAMSTEID